MEVLGENFLYKAFTKCKPLPGGLVYAGRGHTFEIPPINETFPQNVAFFRVGKRELGAVFSSGSVVFPAGLRLVCWLVVVCLTE